MTHGALTLDPETTTVELRTGELREDVGYIAPCIATSGERHVARAIPRD